MPSLILFMGFAKFQVQLRITQLLMTSKHSQYLEMELNGLIMMLMKVVMLFMNTVHLTTAIIISMVNITANDTDKQCANNRVGLLCGKCNYAMVSLKLGRIGKCGDCSEYNLFLFVLFALAGVALVVLLLALKLTVAHGTINGFIFYCNIFYVNRLIEKDVNGLQFLNVLLAWLNLDFGIEMCLYDRLDTYQHTWLQFLFPLYIWLLIGVVIISSRYSSWMTRKLGRNPVAVLATLLLLSYNKILQTIITVFTITQLKYININSTINHTYKTVWLYDASISFNEVKFIVLFVAASLVLIFLLLPYTLLLVFGQCLQAKSNFRVFSDY